MAHQKLCGGKRFRTRSWRTSLQGWCSRRRRHPSLLKIEGIDLALTFLVGKREEAFRLSAKTQVDLGMPARPVKTK